MATFHFHIDEYGHTPPGVSPVVIEVSASGEDIAELARERGVVSGRATANKPLLLGALLENGEFYHEYDLELGIDSKWIKELVPEAVKRQAWGVRTNPLRRDMRAQIREAEREAREKEEEAVRLEDEGYDASDAWADADEAQEELESLYEQADKLSGSKQKRRVDNPRRPPKLWMKHCVEGVRAGGGAADPGAVCGALWYKKMSPSQRRASLRKEDKMNENPDRTLVREYKQEVLDFLAELSLDDVERRRGGGNKLATVRQAARQILQGDMRGADTIQRIANGISYRTIGCHVKKCANQRLSPSIADAITIAELIEQTPDYRIEAYRKAQYPQGFRANPVAEGTALLIGLGALVAIGGVIWAVNRSKENTGTKPSQPLPPPATCSFDGTRVHAFAMSKGLFGIHVPTKIPTWKASFPPPWIELFKLLPLDKNTPAPLLVLEDDSFWTYDFNKGAAPTKRDDLRDEYCKLFGSPESVRATLPTRQSPASVFLPSGI